MENLTIEQKNVYEALIRLGDSKEIALKTVLSKEFKHQQECHKLQLAGVK